MILSNNLFSITEYKSRQIVYLEDNLDASSGTVNDIPASDTVPCNPAEVVTQPQEQIQASDQVQVLEDPVVNSYKESIAANIKAAIYNRTHPSITGVTTSTYGMNFDEICTKLGVAPGVSIKKADLTVLTRNDVAEDANNDFYGALNRAFSYLKPTDSISYNDLMLFFMRGAGTDGDMNLSEYKAVVNKYSDIVQQQYQACTTEQQKLEFALEKTKDYLIESNMIMQLDALERLTTEPCASENVVSPDLSYEGAVEQIASVGQIAFANLGDWEFSSDGSTKTITKGAYTTTRGSADETLYHSELYMWAGDDDYAYNNEGVNYWADGGITLNSTYYLDGESPKLWYEIVETLVHELTHASAYFYYTVTNRDGGRYISLSKRGIDFIKSRGFDIDDYEAIHHSDVLNWYKITSMYHEWAAYTTSCNYWDSIGGDVFDSSQDLTAVGTKEQEAIQEHLDSTGYNLYEADGKTVISQVPNPMAYLGWDYDDFQNAFYNDLYA